MSDLPEAQVAAITLITDIDYRSVLDWNWIRHHLRGLVRLEKENALFTASSELADAATTHFLAVEYLLNDFCYRFAGAVFEGARILISGDTTSEKAQSSKLSKKQGKVKPSKIEAKKIYV